MFDGPDDLARVVAEVTTADLVDRAVAAWRARLVRPSFAPLTTTFGAVVRDRWDGHPVRLRAPAGVMLGNDALKGVMAFAGKAVRIAPPALDAFVELVGGPMATDALRPDGTRPTTWERRPIFTELVRWGLAEIVG